MHDIKIAPKLIIDFKAKIVMADGAYDSDELRRQIRKFGGTDCIKPRKNRKEEIKFDKEQYKERHLVECFFQKINCDKI